MIERQRARRRVNILPQAVFLALTFLAAMAGAYVTLRLVGEDSQPLQAPQIITVEIIITATPLPTKLATAAPAPGQRSQVELPLDVAAEAATESAATIDASSLGARAVPISTPTVAGIGGSIRAENCIYHSVLSGDTPLGIAQRYGADFKEMLEVNDLTDESSRYLQIGDLLIVPLEGCVQAMTGSVAPAPAVPAPAATSTPVSARFEIAAVEGLGDITAESVRLRNTGERVNMTGWTLADESGASFTFPVTMLFPQGEVTVFSRSGTSTGDARFWGRAESVWEHGEELTLRDEAGRILLSLQIPENGEA